MSIKLAERLLLEKYKLEPFHNIYYLNNVEPTTFAYGGTCSDKTLSYLKAARSAGLDAHLHSARIGGQEIHRLVRLKICGKSYFADVGNGWPSIHLFSAEQSTSYECYGMHYRTEISNGLMSVYHLKCGVEKKQMELDISEKTGRAMEESIKHRFSSNIIYPFHNRLRFSMVVGSRFLFIRDNKLEIYSNSSYEELYVCKSDLKGDIRKYFSYDLAPIECICKESQGPLRL